MFQSLDNNIRYIKDNKIYIQYKKLKYKPKITVIVPIYNTNTSQKNRKLEQCSNFFISAIKSVLYQTFKDYELLLINDGISDDTLVLLNEFVNQNIKNIKVINFKDENGQVVNKGLNYWRSKSIELASCEYIKFLDSDDFLYHECLERYYEIIKEYKVDSIFHLRNEIINTYKNKIIVKTNSVMKSSSIT